VGAGIGGLLLLAGLFVLFMRLRRKKAADAAESGMPAGDKPVATTA
jgi:hypothetical protein